jgi:membrane-associated phospholipid phosphatase
MSDSIFQSANLWTREFLSALPMLLPRWIGAWLVSLLVLLYSFRAIKPRLRSHVLEFDEKMNAFARRLRYRLQQVDAALEPDKQPDERVLLTWFFRFWTNFASAPSLSVISIALPIWMYHRYFVSLPDIVYPTHYLSVTDHWLLPALCYFGSMGLSYILKRVFKRLRPVREKGAFGHSLKDGSFPSGHSLTAFCFWMMCVLAFIHGGGTPESTLLLALVAVSIIFLTGLSRIYMAVHWPSDVAGGCVIGIVWTTFCFLALRGAL